ncbi:hypothetical protein GCM10007939_01750 [Amylibacter marinus]|uniref:Copper(I)-binding protein n=1 Tax=Amylibacter marinus TaxID=1475483 RepID=A0ABQ5VRL2_9RHOB|nr:copper chaperone PCu(A)C [Amylibacter marinus]GLQ33892.1 hypothetical protein GCM10007939_01750 [Amylibacter marinus]
MKRISLIPFSIVMLIILAISWVFAYGPCTRSGEMAVVDAYARASSPSAKTGAAFFVLKNGTQKNDRLIAAKSDVAHHLMLHTHKIDANGVAQMVHLMEGFAIEAGAEFALKRGGAHVMLMGLQRPLVDGQKIPLTLVFENAGEIILEVTVDNNRKAKHAH